MLLLLTGTLVRVPSCVGLFLLLFALAGAILALAAAALLLPAGQRLKPAQHTALPCLEVPLHTTVTALGHVAVPLTA